MRRFYPLSLGSLLGVAAATVLCGGAAPAPVVPSEPPAEVTAEPPAQVTAAQVVDTVYVGADWADVLTGPAAVGARFRVASGSLALPAEPGGGPGPHTPVYRSHIGGSIVEGCGGDCERLPIATWSGNQLRIARVPGVPPGTYGIDWLVAQRDGTCGFYLPSADGGWPPWLALRGGMLVTREGGEPVSWGHLVGSAPEPSDADRLCDRPEARALLALLALQVPNLVEQREQARSTPSAPERARDALPREEAPRFANLAALNRLDDLPYPWTTPRWPLVQCEVTVFVDVEGRPTRARPLNCPSALHEPIRDAVQQWRWQPYLEGGEPVPAETDITLRFSPRAK